MSEAVKIGDKKVGNGHPVFVIADIGLNHNGDIDIAKKLIDATLQAKCDAVKFQKRTPEVCVPENVRNIMRETPWGSMTYFDYRHHVELGLDEYKEIDRYCKEKGMLWFASCWDEPSVDFIKQFDPPCYKISSASLTDDELLKYFEKRGQSIIISTGMSTTKEINHAMSLLNQDKLLIAHCTSTYPCKPSELNLRMIQTLQNEFQCPIGYSGHEVGLQTTYAAVVLGACFVERHITLDRSMWGSDQAASLEPQGFNRLVRDIRVIEEAMGDGVKKVFESENPVKKKLRRVGL